MYLFLYIPDHYPVYLPIERNRPKINAFFKMTTINFLLHFWKGGRGIKLVNQKPFMLIEIDQHVKKKCFLQNDYKKNWGRGCIKLVNQKPLVFHDNLDIKDFIMCYGFIKHNTFNNILFILIKEVTSIRREI